MSTGAKRKDLEREKRKIKCVKQMKEIMTQYYIEAMNAGQTGKKVAWITSGGPVEPPWMSSRCIRKITAP